MWLIGKRCLPMDPMEDTVMNNALRITAFAAALAATFGTAYGVGRGVDPLVAAEDRPAGQHMRPR